MPISPVRPAPASSARRVDSTPAAARSKAVVPSNARVAVIGDSHTAWGFGDRLKPMLKDHLKTGGGKLTSFDGIPSASVSHFLEGSTTRAGNQTFHAPKLSDVLAKRPKVLVVALGTNMLFNASETNQQQIRALLKQTDKAGTKVVWVGPPDVHGYGGNLAGPKPEARFYAALRAVNADRTEAGKAPVTIIDSRPSTLENQTADGVHFTGAPAKKWARAVFDAMTA